MLRKNLQATKMLEPQSARSRSNSVKIKLLDAESSVL